MSIDKRYDRGFDKLTADFVRARLESIDQQLNDPVNARRVEYWFQQREFWEKQLARCQQREGLSCPK